MTDAVVDEPGVFALLAGKGSADLEFVGAEAG
jgi:hypothetical protein